MNKLIDHMVNRFLGWKLPKDFNPDCFIDFNRDKADMYGWPSGTNLFTADQARVMFEILTAEFAPDERPKATGEASTIGETSENKQLKHQFFNARLGKPYVDPIESEIKAKGLTAPRVTPADIEANIVYENYFTAAEGVMGADATVLGGGTVELGDPGHEALELLTFCVLVLRNGFTVTGESACASPENFDAEIGRKIARENAKQKIWPLMGYALKQKLSEGAA